MRNDPRAIRNMTAGLWLVGIGLLIATRFWWPGLLFLAGLTGVVQGLLDPKRHGAFQGGLAIIFLGFWAATRFSVTVVIVGLGLFLIYRAFEGAGSLSKPYVDNTLE